MNEIHIASCVAFVKPGEAAAIVARVQEQRLGEVPRSDAARGRLVILIERTRPSEVLDAIDAIRSLPGVHAVQLVYQHAEPESDMQEPHP